MGRTGTLYAWEQEGAVPDIQIIGKCLGGGYRPITGLRVNNHVIDVNEGRRQSQQGSGKWLDLPSLTHLRNYLSSYQTEESFHLSS
jgi:4-aminobutyrate aminotransferase-like enzyme